MSWEQVGRDAFAVGARRVVPQSVLVEHGTDAARAWYRGWDAANLAAPVPDDPFEEPQLELVNERTGRRFGVWMSEYHGRTVVRIYDLTYQGDQRFPEPARGQFVAEYYPADLLTLSGALDLRMDVPAWKLTAANAAALKDFIIESEGT
jgi:hypothetical protein